MSNTYQPSLRQRFSDWLSDTTRHKSKSGLDYTISKYGCVELVPGQLSKLLELMRKRRAVSE